MLIVRKFAVEAVMRVCFIFDEFADSLCLQEQEQAEAQRLADEEMVSKFVYLELCTSYLTTSEILEVSVPDYSSCWFDNSSLFPLIRIT